MFPFGTVLLSRILLLPSSQSHLPLYPGRQALSSIMPTVVIHYAYFHLRLPCFVVASRGEQVLTTVRDGLQGACPVIRLCIVSYSLYGLSKSIGRTACLLRHIRLCPSSVHRLFTRLSTVLACRLLIFQSSTGILCPVPPDPSPSLPWKQSKPKQESSRADAPFCPILPHSMALAPGVCSSAALTSSSRVSVLSRVPRET